MARRLPPPRRRLALLQQHVADQPGTFPSSSSSSSSSGSTSSDSGPWSTLSVEQLTPFGLGALVAGVDPSNVSAAAASELRAVFQKHKVLFIHAPPGLSADTLVEFGRLFGEPNIYPRAGFEPGDGQNPHALPVLQREDSTTVPFGAAGWVRRLSDRSIVTLLPSF